MNNNKKLKLPSKDTNNINLGNLSIRNSIKINFNIVLGNGHEINKEAPNMWHMINNGKTYFKKTIIF